MKKLPFLAATALIVGIAGAAALAQPGADAPRPDRNADQTRAEAIAQIQRRFQRLDLDHDGRFTREESQQIRAQMRQRMADRMFDRMDADHDGSITREEMNQTRAARQQARPGEGGRHHPRMHRRSGHHARSGGGRMFGEQGYVTLDQMQARALARFDRLDANHDGTVTATERQQARSAMRQRMRERRSRMHQPQGEAPSAADGDSTAE
jgi:Ca2+-binding EF-hand superfamily protein